MATVQQATNKPDRIMSKLAQGAIHPYRFVTFGADDAHVRQATAADTALGVVLPGQIHDESLPLPEGRILDFATKGMPHVEYGATIALGQSLSPDADGRAVPTPAGAVPVGIALWPGVAGDIGSIDLDKH